MEYYNIGDFVIEGVDEAGGACIGGHCGCASSRDCTGGDVCNPATAGCVGCISNADCQNPNWPVCTGGSCAACVTHDDCAAWPGRTACWSGTCGCANDGECATEAVGSQCSMGSCGCATSAHCASSADGTVCRDGSCGCTGHTDCANGMPCDQGKCLGPCTDNYACTDAYRPTCNTVTGLCQGCVVTADCEALGEFPHCTAEGWCGCEEDGHCVSDPLGYACLAGRCGCNSPADCPADRQDCASDGICYSPEP